MIATNILWDVSNEDIAEEVMTKNIKDASECLGLTAHLWEDLSYDQRFDVAESLFKHCPELINDFFMLPNIVKIPSTYNFETVDEISDWLSDSYGFLHKGFDLIPDFLKEEKVEIKVKRLCKTCSGNCSEEKQLNCIKANCSEWSYAD